MAEKATAETPKKKVEWKGVPPYGTEFTGEHTLTKSDLRRLGVMEPKKDLVFTRDEGFVLAVDASDTETLEALAKVKEIKVHD